jgi:hypothetical protein
MNNKEEYIKCLNDPYYFFTKYCVIKDKNTGKLIKFQMSKIQYKIYAEYINRKQRRMCSYTNI